jgi:hypothetical protein
MTDSEARSVRLPSFDGTHGSFQRWWMRFKAYARVHKFIQALLSEPGDPNLAATDAAALDTDVYVAALQTLAKKRMAQFTMAFVADSELSLIYEAESPLDWPNRKASCVVDSLFKKYCPQDTASLVELQSELASV